MNPNRSRTLVIVTPIVLILAVWQASFTAVGQEQSGAAAKFDSAALAIYADAANFQTNGALDLAIESWREFLKKFPQDKLAPKAAHYLGVCYMSTDPPDLAKAAAAFGIALKTQTYELREESLANRGWCLYAAATKGDQPDKSLLQESLKTYQQLLKEFPESQYRDRAYFYSGESAYTLGELKSAIEYYSKLLQMSGGEKSPLRCDALYARGIAQEESDDVAAAAKSYEQLLQACVESDLVVDVQLRLADLEIVSQHYDDAITLLQQVIDESTGLATADDRALAIFRLAFCYAKLSKPLEAAKRYEQLLSKYPDSRFVAASRLAAAQSLYQAGETQRSADAFRIVLAGERLDDATEAAHWLARIDIAKAAGAPQNSPELKAAAESAYRVAARQLETGAEGQYAAALQLDAAEALSFQKDRLSDAVAGFEAVAAQYPESPLAPRAIYLAAYTALQLGRHDQAERLANDFSKRYAENSLAPDAAFIGAEAKLLAGRSAEAAKDYQRLLADSANRDHPQRVQWILRAATALQAADQPGVAASVIAAELSSIEKPSDLAQAYLSVGRAQLKTGDAAAAAESFQASRAADPKNADVAEALLLAGQANLQAGDQDAAAKLWRELVNTSPQSKTADQARYKLGQLASDDGDYAAAIEQFEPVIQSARDPALRPFALYGKGWAQMSLQDYASAAETLSEVISEFPQHPILDDALLARGISLRNLKQYDRAASDLTQFLATQPTGTRLGHALYELALVHQKQNQPAQSAARLNELVQQVPDYAGMDKVLYELGWSLKEAGQTDAAIKQFQSLIADYPENDMVQEAAYFVGQNQYQSERWAEAAKSFEIAAAAGAENDGGDEGLLEKSLYRLGWSRFKSGDYAGAEAAFGRQYRDVPAGPLSLDAMMMIGESRFKQNQFETALKAYNKAREKIVADNDSAKTIRDDAERQVRELTLLHGGQSAAQLKQWSSAIEWYDELRQRFPATTYLPQVFYESGFAYQQAGDEERALRLYEQVAESYRNELAARARFMMGEIYFAQKQYSKAIPEFQRVMYGFGAEQATNDIKNWQAKSGFEAGRCAESLVDVAKTESARAKARGFAERFYQYVVDRHGDHELAQKAQERLQSIQG